MSEHYSQPRTLQMEISSNCNLNCLGCCRTDWTSFDMKGDPRIPKNMYLTLDIFKQIIESPVSIGLEEVQFCGTVDDPLVHPDFIDMVKFLANKKIRTLVHTNASLRTPDYFKTLGDTIYGKVQFSMDGLENTNHLYRRGSNFQKIMENAKAYIATGANAQWQYIEFPWNESDTEKARQLARDMGFRTFKCRRDRSETPTPGQYKDHISWHLRQVKMTWEEYKATKEKNIHNESIECFSREDGMYFISYDSKVWPCCFLRNADFQQSGTYKEHYDRYNLNYGENWNSLKHYSFQDIVENRFYSEDLVDSWESKSHGLGPKDRLIRCTSTCSKSNKCARPIGNFKVEVL